MSDPTRLSEEEQAKATLHAETEEINRLERLLAQHGQAAQSLAEVEEPLPVKEKLFSRRTLFGWAFGTLVIVFVIRMVVPVVFDTVKSEVVGRLHEAEGNSAVTPVVAPTPPTTVGAPAPEAPERPEAPARPETGSGKSATTAGPAKSDAPTVIRIVKKR